MSWKPEGSFSSGWQLWPYIPLPIAKKKILCYPSEDAPICRKPSMDTVENDLDCPHKMHKLVDLGSIIIGSYSIKSTRQLNTQKNISTPYRSFVHKRAETKNTISKEKDLTFQANITPSLFNDQGVLKNFLTQLDPLLPSSTIHRRGSKRRRTSEP